MQRLTDQLCDHRPKLGHADLRKPAERHCPWASCFVLVVQKCQLIVLRSKRWIYCECLGNGNDAISLVSNTGCTTCPMLVPCGLDECFSGETWRVFLAVMKPWCAGRAGDLPGCAQLASLVKMSRHAPICRTKENRAASLPGTIYVYANNFSGRDWTCQHYCLSCGFT